MTSSDNPGEAPPTLLEFAFLNIYLHDQVLTPLHRPAYAKFRLFWVNATDEWTFQGVLRSAVWQPAVFPSSYSSVCWYSYLSVLLHFPLIFLNEWNVENESIWISVRRLRHSYVHLSSQVSWELGAGMNRHARNSKLYKIKNVKYWK